MRRACITGGAGFIGSNLADRLIQMGAEVVVLDNFRTGQRRFLESIVDHPKFTLIEGDLLDPSVPERAIEGCDWVFHLQANADVRNGTSHPTYDLEQNTITTSRVLEAMRSNDVHRIVFSSTGSVYGEPDVFPTPEDAPFPKQTSFYGASKVAGEALIAAYSTGFDFTGIICRFVSVLGERYTHGHVRDFYHALRNDPSQLLVQGNGKQEKSYLYVHDCIDAILSTVSRHENEVGTFAYNLGTNETIVVDESIKIITSFMNVAPDITYTGGERGWIGDSPLINLDTTRIRNLGWSPQLTISDSIVRTLQWLEKDDPLSRNDSPFLAFGNH